MVAILVVVYEVRVVPTGTIYVALIASLNDVTIAVTVDVVTIDMVPFYSECLPSSYEDSTDSVISITHKGA